MKSITHSITLLRPKYSKLKYSNMKSKRILGESTSYVIDEIRDILIWKEKQLIKPTCGSNLL